MAETRVRLGRKQRVCQGDVYRNIDMIEYVAEKGGYMEVSRINYPLVVVLTQDCDLEQDHKFQWSRNQPSTRTQDKCLIAVLVAPVYNAEHVYLGEHLSALHMSMEPIPKNKSPGQFLRKNQIPRYHYLAFPSSVAIVDSVIDFKHYFSINGRYLRRMRRDHFVCRLDVLYREDLSHRFAAYLSRIGLPGPD